MASKTPTADTITPTATPVAAPVPVPAPVKPAAKVPPKAEAAPKAAPAPAKPVTKPAVAKVTKAARKVTATVVKPLAKKRVAAKAAPKVAPKTAAVKIITPVVAKAKAVTTEGTIIMENTIKDVAEKAKTLFTDSSAKSTKAFAELNDFGKGNIEAIVESGKIAAKGIEALGQEAADYGRKQVESATAALKSLSSVKSPTDFFKLQSDYVRASFDSLVAQTSKNTEAMLKLAGDVAQPIQNRVAVAVEKVKIAA